jgi:hypothetical protein
MECFISKKVRNTMLMLGSISLIAAVLLFGPTSNSIPIHASEGGDEAEEEPAIMETECGGSGGLADCGGWSSGAYQCDDAVCEDIVVGGDPPEGYPDDSWLDMEECNPNSWCNGFGPTGEPYECQPYAAFCEDVTVAGENMYTEEDFTGEETAFCVVEEPSQTTQNNCEMQCAKQKAAADTLCDFTYLPGTETLCNRLTDYGNAYCTSTCDDPFVVDCPPPQVHTE